MTNSLRSSAINDFHNARSRAFLKDILARLTGESSELLSYWDVRELLKAQESSVRGLRDIPLDAIVGSVGRYTDFTRDFLPRQSVSPDRWANVKVAVEDLKGLPPIEVYQIGEVYFVKDGNHRVSVARQFGASFIQAYVTEVRTRVPLTPDIQPDDLILKAEYVQFLESTQLDRMRPTANLEVSIPGKYALLEEHILVHHYYMGIEQKREIPYSEAVAHWYDNVYLPVVQSIREKGILRYFPNRTETDLYLWIGQHRAELENQLGWSVKPDYAIEDLATAHGIPEKSVFERIGTRILDAVAPETLESGPPVGNWRRQKTGSHIPDRLFNDVLVPVSNTPGGWNALAQALIIAGREKARLLGLHILPDQREAESCPTLEFKASFEQRCTEAGISGQLVIVAGDITSEICNRAHWSDLVVVNLAHPPGPKPLARLDSGFRELIQRSSRPILAAPQVSTPLKHALLAYDGSPKAHEALFIAAYLAEAWQIPLSVLTVFSSGDLPPETLLRAQVYLEEHGVQANYIAAKGTVATAILNTAKARNVDLVIMGGYGRNPVLEMVLGSSVDQVLRASKIPILICR